MRLPLRPTTPVIDEHLTTAARQAGSVFRSRFGIWLLAMISFVESALVVPIVTDPFLVAYILAERRKTLLAVIVTTATSLLGGLAAYAMALTLFEVVAARLLTPELLAEFYVIAAGFREGTFTLTLLGAVTPIPYTLVALAAGFVKGSLLAFIAASLLGRGARYALVGYLTHRFGARALEHVQRHVTLVTLATVAAVALYYFFFHV